MKTLTPRLLATAAALAIVVPGAACAADETAADLAATAPAPIDAATLHEVDARDASLVWPHGWLANADEDLFEDIDDMDIYGPEGDQIGEVEEALADAQNNVVAFGVETEGFLDIGDADVIVPLERLELGPEGDSFVTNMTEDELEALPEWED